MKYMGSKARHAKDILPIILAERKPNQLYVEPFVGGANVIDKVEGRRIGSDVHEYLIAMWDAVSKGWIPPAVITEDDYNAIKKDKQSFPREFVGYVGFAMSYGGKWFGGWRRDSIGKRDYVEESRKNAEKQFPNLRGVIFKHTSYDELRLDEQCIIYCDPPYKGTTKYKDDFNHEKFYDWCRKMKKDGHTIFVSEYEMPEDFICVWQKEVTSSLTKDTGSKKAVEKLFTLNGLRNEAEN